MPILCGRAGFAALGLCIQDPVRFTEHLVEISGVVDIAAPREGDGFVDRAEPAVAEEAGFEVFGRGGEVAGVLLVAEVAGCTACGGGGGGVGTVEDGGRPFRAGAGCSGCGGGDGRGVD